MSISSFHGWVGTQLGQIQIEASVLVTYQLL